MGGAAWGALAPAADDEREGSAAATTSGTLTSATSEGEGGTELAQDGLPAPCWADCEVSSHGALRQRAGPGHGGPPACDGWPAEVSASARRGAGRSIAGCLMCVWGGWVWVLCVGFVCLFVVLRVCWVRSGRPARKRMTARQEAWRRKDGRTACSVRLPRCRAPAGSPTACRAISAGRVEIADFGRLRNLFARPREPD